MDLGNRAFTMEISKVIDIPKEVFITLYFRNPNHVFEKSAEQVLNLTI